MKRRPVTAAIRMRGTIQKRFICTCTISLLIGMPLVAASGPLSDVISGLGLPIGGSVGDIQILNPGDTGANDSVGFDLLNTGSTFGLVLDRNELAGERTGGAPLDALGLGPLLRGLGLDGATLATTLRGLASQDGTLTLPIVEIGSEFASAMVEAGLDLSLALGLPGLADDAAAVSILGGDNSGQGDLVGIAVLGGENSGNGELVGLAVLGGNGSGSGELAGAAVLSGDNSGRGGDAGIAVLSGDSSGSGDAAGVAVLSGADSGTGEGITGSVLNDGQGDVGAVNLAVLNLAKIDTAVPEPNIPCADGQICDREDPEPAMELTGCFAQDDCVLVEGNPLILRGVHFEFDSATLKPESIPVLERAAALLKRYPEVLISVDGHTDALGTEPYNERLSTRRARAVMRYFVEAGVDARRLAYRGFGEGAPIAPNELDDGTDNPSGRAMNRRVELNVINAETFAALAQR